MSGFNKNLFYFITGLTTGAILGVLLAPDSGKNTRDKLSYQIDKYLAKLKLALGNIRANATLTNEKISELNVTEYKKAEELLKEVEDLLEEIKTKSVK